MNKKALVISAAALGVLGAILAALLILLPANEAENPSEQSVPTVCVTDKNREDVKSVYIENEKGSFLFTRAEKTTDDKTEFYWTSGELLGVLQDDTVVNTLVGGLAGLSRQPLVEENAQNLEKYGLENPLAKAKVTFDDNTVTELYFGVSNPSDAAYYFRTENNTVMTADKETVWGVFADIRDFAELTLTKSLSETTVERVKIERKDLEQPVELCYMSELLSDSDFISATPNTHRFTSPFSAEVDSTAGAALYNDLCALTMSRCVFLEKSKENLEKCGLSDPFTVVSFTLGTEEHTLFIGDEITRSLDGGTAETIGFYAALDGVNGIFELAADDAVWQTFVPEKFVSKCPLSPYIYYVKRIEISAAGENFAFDIDGENKQVFFGESEVDLTLFRSFYKQLIGSYGEEYYTGEISGEPIFSVRFIYSEEYADKYGCEENLVEFYGFDERKNVAAIDKKAVFKVSAIYAQRLCENVLHVVNGEEITNL